MGLASLWQPRKGGAGGCRKKSDFWLSSNHNTTVGLKMLSRETKVKSKRGGWGPHPTNFTGKFNHHLEITHKAEKKRKNRRRREKSLPFHWWWALTKRFPLIHANSILGFWFMTATKVESLEKNFKFWLKLLVLINQSSNCLTRLKIKS